MDNFILITAYLLLGMGIRRLSKFPRDTGTVLYLYVIYIALPAVVLLKIPQLSWSASLLVPALLPWLMLALSAMAVLLLARLLHWSRAVTGCLLLLVPMGNTSFLGIPMVRAFFGEAAISYAVIYDQLGSFLALATYGSLIIAWYGGEASRPSLRDVGLRIVTFPPFIALLLAVLLKPIAYPPVFIKLLEALAATLVPVVMIAVGFQLTPRLSRGSMLPLTAGLALKLVAAPLIALLLCRVAGLNGEAVGVAIFESGMPPMVSAGALAIMAGLAPELTAALVGAGILLSFLTLPLLFQLL